MPQNPITFLVIGAQKCGTSWLARMLEQHPEILVPSSKELHFFNNKQNYDRGLSWYLSNFQGSERKIAVGECTPNYLWVCDAPCTVNDRRQRLGKPLLTFASYDHLIRDAHRLVHRALPNAQLIVSLRNPVDRAIASFYHQIRARRVHPSANILEVAGEQGILGMGFYHAQLVEWIKFFKKSRFLFLVYEEDIKRKKEETLENVFRFLDVDGSFRPDATQRYVNKRASGPFMRAHYYAPKTANIVFRMVPQLNNLGILDLPEISLQDRAELADIYREENTKLENLINRDLSCWGV